MKIQIINGPNLNLLGTREPGIYGSTTFEACLEKLRRQHPRVEIDYFQSNIEGELIDKLHQTGFSCDGIVLNAGAYTHTSIALLDCIRSLKRNSNPSPAASFPSRPKRKRRPRKSRRRQASLCWILCVKRSRGR